MNSTEANDESDLEPGISSRTRRRLAILFAVVLVILLLVFVPPLINMGRFRQRVERNIGSALGRPVHFDSVTLMLLPLPGFTLNNFVIDEDPAFGYEPVLRANEVTVTLRLSSIFTRHIEFSKISFTEPSVNLVHASSGRWNVESLLLQASHIQAAPTAQPHAGAARRFPYIEATGARLNLKLDQQKTPVSLTDADFALWLPEPHQWRLRLEAHPTRTDSAPGDTGTLRAEGTLGGANFTGQSLAQIPIDIHGDWRDAQLGGLSRLLIGYDPGVRGDLSVGFALEGTIGQSNIATHITVEKARRADFVPDTLLSLDVACQAVAAETFHAFPSIECRWPPADSSDPALLALKASIPDVTHPDTATASLSIPGLPADTLFDWLSVVTPHPPSVMPGAGTLAGSLAWGEPAEPVAANSGHGHAQPAPAQPSLSGQLELSGSSLALGSDTNESLPLGDVSLRSTPPPAPTPHSRTASAPASVHNSFDLLPVSLALGGKQPATLEGHFDLTGYSLHLSGNVVYSRLLALAAAVPQFGDGLKAFLNVPPDAESTPASAQPVHVDLTATRNWGGAQTWTQTVAAPPAPKRRHR